MLKNPHPLPLINSLEENRTPRHPFVKCRKKQELHFTPQKRSQLRISDTQFTSLFGFRVTKCFFQRLYNHNREVFAQKPKFV